MMHFNMNQWDAIKAGKRPVIDSPDDPMILGFAADENEATAILDQFHEGGDFTYSGLAEHDLEVSDPDGYYTGSGQSYSMISAWMPDNVREIEG